MLIRNDSQHISNITERIRFEFSEDFDVVALQEKDERILARDFTVVIQGEGPHPCISQVSDLLNHHLDGGSYFIETPQPGMQTYQLACNGAFWCNFIRLAEEDPRINLTENIDAVALFDILISKFNIDQPGLY